MSTSTDFFLKLVSPSPKLQYVDVVSFKTTHEDQCMVQCIHINKMVVTFAIKNDANTSPITWFETIEINGNPVAFRIDTGSDVNLISYETCKKLKPKIKLTSTDVELSSYSGHTINILGSSEIKCTKNGKQHLLKFFITKMNLDSVLGLPACIDLGIVATVSTPIEANSAEKIARLYVDVFSPPGILRCEPYHINLLPNVKPIHSSPRKLNAVETQILESELKAMIQNGYLEKVEDDLAAKWSHPLIIAPKCHEFPSMKIYMDCRILNKYVFADYIPLPAIEDALQETKGSQFYSILSSPQACMQISLDDYSSNICTVSTPLGKFNFKTIPYGLVAGSRIFHFISSQMFDGMDGVICYMDEILVHGRNKNEHNSRLLQVLERARRYNLKFSKGRLQLAKAEVRFVGYLLFKGEVSVDARKVEAVSQMKTPANKQELHRFLGIIDFLSQWTPNVSLQTEPLERILTQSEKFCWGKEQATVFDALKKTLCETSTLKVYNPNKAVFIHVAASTYGLGVVVLQDFLPLGYHSTFLTSNQQKYQQVEKKLLAVLYGLEKFYYYTYSKEVIVQTDYRPLLTVIKEPLHMLSTVLQKLILKLVKFDFKLEYLAGNNLIVAYALSRNPLTPVTNKYISENVIEPPHSLLLYASEERVVDFKQSLKDDQVLQSVITYIKEGWPKYLSWVKSEVRKFFHMKDDLHYNGELLFYDNRVVVPQKEVEKVLKQLHAAHQSAKFCLQKAKLMYFWPNMQKDIENFVESCQICQKGSQPLLEEADMTSLDIIELPWNKLGVTLLEIDRKCFVIIIDHFSKFLIVKSVNVKTAKALVIVLEDVFATHGLPLELVSENSPPFNTSELRLFLKNLDIKHSLCAETNTDLTNAKYTQICKSLITKSLTSKTKLFVEILEYNSAPKQNFPSPSELLMGRRLRTNLLLPRTMLIPNFDIGTPLWCMRRGDGSKRGNILTEHLNVAKGDFEEGDDEACGFSY